MLLCATLHAEENKDSEQSSKQAETPSPASPSEEISDPNSPPGSAVVNAPTPVLHDSQRTGIDV